MMLITPFTAFDPSCSSPATDNFDTVDVFQRDVVAVPKHAGGERIVDRSSVDQNQNLVRIAIVKAPNTDGILVDVDSGYVDAGRRSEALLEQWWRRNGGYPLG